MESKGNNLVSTFMQEGTTTDEFIQEIHLIKELPVAIYTCDPEGRVTFYNEAAANLWGKKPELGKDLWYGSWRIFDANGFPIDPEETPIAKALREKREIEGEPILVERPDGKRINLVPRPKPIFDATGNMTAVVTTLIELPNFNQSQSGTETTHYGYNYTPQLTHQSNKNNLLQENEERYHKMIDEVEDYAILLLNLEGNILNWNKGAESIKGYKEKEILGKNFRVFYQEEDQKAGLPERLMGEAVVKGKAMHEGWRVRKDGTKFWGSVVITALHDDLNKIIGFSKVTRDLTERKKAEDKLRYYAQNIESQNKQLEQYAYIASHDLQEPLRKIRVFTSMLEAQIDNKEAVVATIAKINTAANRMAILIKDILNYSQLTELDTLFAKTDLNEVMENVKEDFSLLIEEKGVVIQNDKLPVLKAIPMQMQQLFANLISNSIKFNNNKPLIQIFYEKIEKDKASEYPQLISDMSFHKFTLKDNGIGFDQEYAAEAFKLFHRLHHKTSGTGIGLALCKKIIENHNGVITVQSKPEKGTTFTLFFPAE